MMKSRNKTIVLSDEEIEHYSEKCRFNENFIPLKNAIIHGDMFEVSKKLPSNFIDLLIADPPYNLTKSYSETTFKKISDSEYADFTERWISQIKPLLKPTASIYVCCDWKSSLIIGSILGKHFFVQNRITWQREKGRGAQTNWKNSMEDIWFCTVSKNEYTFNIDDIKMRRRVIAPYKKDGIPKDWQQTESGNFRDTHPSNFWDDISIPYWSMPENTSHPAQKPEKLMAKLILASSDVGDLIFDPFAGSGTSAVAAKKLGRSFLGIEQEKEYCAVASKRIELAETDSEIQGFSDGVFWERNTLAEQQKTKRQLKNSSDKKAL